MLQNERTGKKKQDDVDEKHRRTQKMPEPLFDQLHACEPGTVSMTDTPFRPHLDEHADSLARAGEYCDEAVQNLMLQMQQTYGNRYVQRLVKTVKLRTKLTINQPNDTYEQEADRVAEAVIKSTTTDIQRQAVSKDEELLKTDRSLRFGASDIGQDGKEKAEEANIHTNPPPTSQPAAMDTVHEVNAEIEDKIDTARHSGEPLASNVRDSMEQAFSADFSGVRVYTDAEADRLNQSLQARAFTTGQDIFFKEGEYKPESLSGQELLAHELTHTLQQGASNRIAPWFPLGHREITEKVLSDPDLRAFYDDAARDYLKMRSPDMDFIQDEASAMVKGMAESEPLVKKLKDITGRWEKATEAEQEDARNMWETNELHKRPKWYMLHHGEGGFYTQDASTAASKNKAVTDTLVKLAVELYNAGKREAGLSILSDALHQAEDRGSHEEGEQFKGHDIRRTIKNFPEGVEQEPPPGYYGGETTSFTDDAGKNRAGAVNALFYAREVLKSFLFQVQDLGVTLGPEKEEQPHPSQRHMKIKASAFGKLTSLSTDVKAKYPGHTSAKTIKGIEPEEYKDLVDIGERRIPKEELSLLLNTISNYIVEWLTSELMELIRKNDSPSRRIEVAIDQFEELRESYPELMEYIPYEQELVICKRALDNYEFQRAKRYSGKEGAEVLEG